MINLLLFLIFLFASKKYTVFSDNFIIKMASDAKRSKFEPNFLQRFAIRLLATAVLPKHVVLVADLSKQTALKGHLKTKLSELYEKFFENAVEIVSWLEYFEIPEVTIYICEPKESKETKGQVKDVMQAIKKIDDYLPQLIDQLKERETRFTFFGDMEFLPKNLRTIFAKAMIETKKFEKNRFNLGFVYTSSDEMDSALETLQKAVQNKELLLEDIDESVINRCLYTGESSPAQLIVRLNTSQSFTDTFLWQQMNAVYSFNEIDTIEITFTQFVTALFFGQFFTNRLTNSVIKNSDTIDSEDNRLGDKEIVEKQRRIDTFLLKKETQFFDYLKKCIP